MKLGSAFNAIVVLLLLIACSAPKSDAQTVYITATGKKYHRESCQYLRKSKYEIGMKEAIDRGLTACSVCSPGGLKAKKESARDSVKNQKPVEKTQDQTQGAAEVKSRQCIATTKAGARCKRMTTNASGKCYQHE
jgi:hypothetical protein